METAVHEIWMGVCLLAVSGDGVSKKDIGSGDPAIRRIMDNPDLYRTIHGQEVLFIRKADVEGALDEARHAGRYVFDVVVTSEGGDAGVEERLAEDKRKVLSVTTLRADPALREFVFGKVFDRLKFPVLLFYLVLLLANWFIFSDLSRRSSLVVRESQATARRVKIDREASERTRALIREYDAAPNPDLPLLCDRIGRSVPENATLTVMTMGNGKGGFEVRIKGEAASAGTVMEFARSLKKDGVFADVDVLEISSREGTEKLPFELIAKPK